MRSLRLAVPAVALAAWLAGSVAQDQPPADTPPPRTPPASTPPASSPPAAPEARTEDEAQPPAEVENEVFVPTEELQPDAAVTFPVDI